jgi:hypothetical protein
MKKLLASRLVAIGLAVLITLAVATSYQRIYYYVFDEFTGREKTWNGIEIRLTAPAYFLPSNDKNNLLIGSRDAPDGLLHLARTRSTASDIQARFSAECARHACSIVAHNTETGRSVLSFGYEYQEGNAKLATAFWWLENSELTITYEGSRDSLPEFQNLANRIALDAAAKGFAHSS